MNAISSSSNGGGNTPNQQRIAAMRTLLTGGLSALLVLAIVSGLEAHTALRTSTPADGETLTALPPSIRLEFTAAIDGSATEVRLVDSAETARELELQFDDAAPTVLKAMLPEDLTSGAYHVSWRTLAADGHPVSGTFAFDLDLPAPPPAPVPPVESGEQALAPAAASEPAENAAGTGAMVLGVLGIGALIAAGLFLRRRTA
jgi:copper resistance protein C